jgi:hypothetical protein
MNTLLEQVSRAHPAFLHGREVTSLSNLALRRPIPRLLYQ